MLLGVRGRDPPPIYNFQWRRRFCCFFLLVFVCCLLFAGVFSFVFAGFFSFVLLVLLGVRLRGRVPPPIYNFQWRRRAEFHGSLQEINLPPPSFLNFIFSYCSAIAPVVRLRISKSCQNHLELHLWLPNYV